MFEANDPEFQAWQEEQARQRQALTHAPQTPAAPAPGLDMLSPTMPRPEWPTENPAQAQAPAPALAPEAAPPFNFKQGPLPPLVKQSQSQSGGQRRTILGKDERPAAEAANQFDQQRAQQVRGAADQRYKDEVTAQEKAFNDEKTVRDSFAEQRAKAEQGANQQVQARMARYAEVEAKLDKMELRDYWADKGTGQKVTAGIAVALGALGGAMSGSGKNLAMERLDQLVARDFQMQRAKIDQVAAELERAGKGVDFARQFREDSMRALDLKEAKALEGVAAQVRFFAAKTGAADKKQLAEQQAQALEANALERRQRLAEVERTEAHSQWNKTFVAQDPINALGGAGIKLTEGQATAASLGTRIVEDYKTLEQTGAMSEEGRKRLRELAAKEQALGPRAVAALTSMGKWKTPEQVLNNDKDRMAFAAGRRFAAGVLRGDSGASISLGEYMNFDQQNFAQQGDKGQDIEAKRRAREQMVKGILIKAGPGAQAVLQSTQAQPAAPAQPAGGQAERMKQLLRDNPNHPKAEAIRAKLREMGAL